MISIRLTFIACILFISSDCQNSAFPFEILTSKDGIADNTVNAITQDAQGFIWIGSEEGLTRYDGYSFVTYRHTEDNKESISDNEIYAFCIDKEGSLWIGTGNGLNRYDAINDRFETFY